MLAGNPAKAGDDFYALGKVIYRALTGHAVNEYPGIPADMTISINANLNKALRESCSQPINSTAEFRKLLAGKHLKKLETFLFTFTYPYWEQSLIFMCF